MVGLPVPKGTGMSELRVNRMRRWGIFDEGYNEAAVCISPHSTISPVQLCIQASSPAPPVCRSEQSVPGLRLSQLRT